MLVEAQHVLNTLFLEVKIIVLDMSKDDWLQAEYRERNIALSGKTDLLFAIKYNRYKANLLSL